MNENDDSNAYKIIREKKATQMQVRMNDSHNNNRNNKRNRQREIKNFTRVLFMLCL